jgi:outer membrane lipoprotein-sorting protein
MRKGLIFVLFSIYLFALTGREVLEKQKKLQASHTESSTEQMLLISSDGEKEKREIKKWIKKDEKSGFRKSLIVFYQPADVRGVALLDKEINKNEDEQWLYIPAIHKLQRIAEGSKKNYFMGTDFTYEDLSMDRLDNYTYRILKIANLRGDDCYIIEAIPTNKYYPKTNYGKKVLWVKKDKFYTERIEFYDKDMKLIKIEDAYNFKNIKGTIYRPQFVKMDNLKEKHKTLVKLNNIKINYNMSEKFFKTRYLLTEQHMNH